MSAFPYLPERTNRRKRNQGLIIHVLTRDCSLGKGNVYDNQGTHQKQGKELNSLAISLWLVIEARGKIRRETGRKKCRSFLFFHFENSECFYKLIATVEAYLSSIVACLLKL